MVWLAACTGLGLTLAAAPAAAQEGALGALPSDLVAAALMLLGLALIAAEAFVPAFGVVGAVGAVVLVVGGTLLLENDLPDSVLSWSVLAGIAVAAAMLVLVVTRLAVLSQRRRVVSGREQMIGMVGRVVDWSGVKGHVHLHGERWRAAGQGAFVEGQEVRVTGLDGLTLQVAGTGEVVAERRPAASGSKE